MCDHAGKAQLLCVGVKEMNGVVSPGGTGIFDDIQSDNRREGDGRKDVSHGKGAGGRWGGDGRLFRRERVLLLPPGEEQRLFGDGGHLVDADDRSGPVVHRPLVFQKHHPSLFSLLFVGVCKRLPAEHRLACVKGAPV